MRIDIITVLPEMIEGFFNCSIIKRAQNKGIVQIKIHNLRDYTEDKYRRVDDYPFGGFAGMVMKIEPIERCINALRSERNYDEVIFTTPDGQQFEQPVKIQVVRNTSSDLYFANMKHYVEENGTWKVESDMTVDPETGDYVGELDHFSSHAFGVEAQWGAKTATTEDGASQEFDNRGKLDAVKVPLTVESKNGWEVDGDLASIIRTALSGVSEADATELASELNRMIRNAKGCESSVSTQPVKLNEISISGDTKATVAVQHKISTSSMTVSVMFKGQPVSISVPVKVYNGVSMKVSYEYGSLTPEHSGGNIG